MIPSTDKRIVLTTCSDLASAEKLARALVEDRLAACVNILPGARSIYRWRGAVETDDELVLLIKTSAEQLARLEVALHQLHNYETPEFVVLEIAAGSAAYLRWLSESVSER